jgi:hypothetical protein
MASAPIHLKFKLMARNIMTLCGLWLLLSSSPSSPSLSTSSSLMSHSYSLPYLSPLSLLISYVTPSLNLNIIRIASAQQTNNSTTNSTTTSNSTSVDPALCNNGDSVGQLAFVSPGNKGNSFLLTISLSVLLSPSLSVSLLHSLSLSLSLALSVPFYLSLFSSLFL